MQEYTWHYESPLGGITMASDGEALTGLWFDGQKYFADTLASYHEEKKLPVFVQTKKWLDLYFRGKNPDFTPPLRLKGSEFRRKVWDILLEIPYGETMTYGEIARKLAEEPAAATTPKNAGAKRHVCAQAVGGAVGHNPISLIVPCHRVVGADGSMTGYAGGIDKKVKLLELEQGAGSR
ncbi:MAG: methylated-DNA--[protein]-cysteine S-methyltransferase [Lachnospiraceae bacterium]|nr:methylated-DNA--[protein]-cysteine S-methyltransferase [Lachnospiraceae bacterium]